MHVRDLRSFLLRHEYLIWILCLCALLRLPSLLEPYWYGDEAIYLTLGHAISSGLQLYKDIHDNKPPILYLLAALSGSVFWFRFLLLVWNSIAIVIFERLSRLLFNEQDDDGTMRILSVSFPIPRWSTLATLLFALLPFFAEGAIANGEIFMIMPVIAGMYALWRSLDGKKKTALVPVAGVLFSLAFLIKVPSLFDAVAAGIFFFLLLPWLQKQHNSLPGVLQASLRPLLAFAVAFLIPIAITMVYYSALGVGRQYVAAAFAQNIGYLSSWSTGTHEVKNIGSSGLKHRAVLLLASVVFVGAIARKQGKALSFVLLWFAFSVFGALLSERPYPHYLIQVIPPVALLVAGLGKLVVPAHFYRNRQEPDQHFTIKAASILICLIVLGSSIVQVKFWYYPLLPYYSNYIAFVAGKISKEAYIAHFDARLPTIYTLATTIQSATSPTDRIFVWGDIPSLYALSRRLPPGRYTSNYHIKDFGGFEETTQAILSTRPKFIIIDTHAESPYPELASILGDSYIPSYQAQGFVVYRYFPRQVQ